MQASQVAAAENESSQRKITVMAFTAMAVLYSGILFVVLLANYSKASGNTDFECVYLPDASGK